MTLQNLATNKSFGGWHKQYSHRSESLNCDMRFAIFLPPHAGEKSKVPVLYWLSGLTCTDENFMQKAGAHRVAAELGMAIVAPDTSPRGEDVPDDAEGAYDFGHGAGFYLNATQAPWDTHYHMYDYVVTELPALIEATFPVTSQRFISGHSMGGHGALTIGQKNPDLYSAITAFSPICNPTQTPWGQKAFQNYLGDDRESWKEYDASEVLKQAETPLPMLVDQGLSDNFLEKELKPERLQAVADEKGADLTLRQHEGYDHSYYFIASFIEDHLRFHAKHMA